MKLSMNAYFINQENIKSKDMKLITFITTPTKHSKYELINLNSSCCLHRAEGIHQLILSATHNECFH